LPIIAALVFLALMVFYLIPGIHHPLVSANPTNAHIKHGILFLGLAILSLVWARFRVNAGAR
ncbi:MAG: hypothetical protein ACYDAG_02040, partial [Chloroflexota bacterium]